MTRTTNNDVPAGEKTDIFPPALMEALLECSSGSTSASTGRLTALARSNNPRFWDSKIRSEQWVDTNGRPFSIMFPAIIEPRGKHSKLDPYFSLPTLKQPMIKDIRTVKAQFQLRTLDNSFPAEAVMCSKKAANTLLYLASNCEKNRDADNREVTPFMRSAGNSLMDELHFVVHSDALFPEATESRGDIVPEFSLEDFENTDFALTGDGLKDRFALKKTGGGDDVGVPKGVNDWTLKDLEDPHGHFKMVIDLYKLDKVPVMVPNVQDAAGNLIHPSEYSKHFTKAMPVAAEVVTRLWTFAPDNKRPTGSRIYQTTLKSLRLLPQSEPVIDTQPKAGSMQADPKGKRKADGPVGGGSPAKKTAGQQKVVGGTSV
ncbi:hypothetical protein F4604DRAFT_1934605 [Suillus subluteus]|nr:hypothetical protein F4604DRAFT_1934605 [Suillus subluteus]